MLELIRLDYSIFQLPVKWRCWSSVRGKEELIHATMWMNPKNIMLRKSMQKEKNSYCIIVLSSIQAKLSYGDRNQKLFAWDGGLTAKGLKGTFNGCENVLYFNCAGSYMVYKLSKPNTLCTWNLWILLYVYCISIGGFSNNVLKWLKATQGVRSRTDTGALVVWLSARPIGLHHPPSSSFLFLDALFSTKSGWWLVLMTKNWEVSMGLQLNLGH